MSLLYLLNISAEQFLFGSQLLSFCRISIQRQPSAFIANLKNDFAALNLCCNTCVFDLMVIKLRTYISIKNNLFPRLPIHV